MAGRTGPKHVYDDCDDENCELCQAHAADLDDAGNVDVIDDDDADGDLSDEELAQLAEEYTESVREREPVHTRAAIPAVVQDLLLAYFSATEFVIEERSKVPGADQVRDPDVLAALLQCLMQLAQHCILAKRDESPEAAYINSQAFRSALNAIHNEIVGWRIPAPRVH